VRRDDGRSYEEFLTDLQSRRVSGTGGARGHRARGAPGGSRGLWHL